MIYSGKDQQEKLTELDADSDGLKNRRKIQEILKSLLITENKSSAKLNHQGSLKEFCGLWSESDLRAFEFKIANSRRIDPEDWK